MSIRSTRFAMKPAAYQKMDNSGMEISTIVRACSAEALSGCMPMASFSHSGDDFHNDDRGNCDMIEICSICGFDGFGSDGFGQITSATSSSNRILRMRVISLPFTHQCHR